MTDTLSSDSPASSQPRSSEPGMSGFRALLAWSLLGQLGLWLLCAGLAIGFLHTSQDQWYVLARTRFLPVLLRLQLGMLPYYLVLGLVFAVWLWMIRRAWIAHLRPVRVWPVRAGMVGLWFWAILTIMAWAVVHHFGSFWSMTTLLADKFDIVIRYRDVAVVRPVVRLSAMLLVIVSFAAALNLAIHILGDPRGRRVVRIAVVIVFLTAVASGAAAMLRSSGHQAAAGVEQAHRSDRPNLIVLASDSLRADHLGCYGYSRDTSPNIDALAAQSVVVEDLLAATGSTTDSWFSTLSGLWPYEHGIRSVFPTCAQAEAAGKIPTVIRRAREEGYRTVVMGDWAGCSFDSIDHGFEVVQVDPDMTFPDYIGKVTEKTHLWIMAATMNPLCQWLGLSVGDDLNRNTYADILDMMDAEFARARRTGQPLLLVAFVSVTHMPYRVYDEFDVRFGEPGYEGPHERAMDVSLASLLEGGASDRLRQSRQRIIDLYDTTIWIFDRMVGRAVESLRTNDLLDSSLVLVTSDHGEDFFEPGTDSSHGKYVNAGLQSFHLPFVLRWPERLSPHRVQRRVRNIDVAPTLVDLLDLPPLGEVSGQSFVDLLLDPTRDDGDKSAPCFFETGFLWDCEATYPPDGNHLGYPAMSMVVSPDPQWYYRMVIPEATYPTVMRAKDRAVLIGDWKLAYLATCGRPTLQLFDIADDPHCRNPLPFDQGPFNDLARQLHAWITADPREEFYLYDGMTRRQFDRLFVHTD